MSSDRSRHARLVRMVEEPLPRGSRPLCFIEAA
jgi:hypothetical protein